MKVEFPFTGVDETGEVWITENDMTDKQEAQTRLDDIDTELNELYRRVREKESERDILDRVANPEYYADEKETP